MHLTSSVPSRLDHQAPSYYVIQSGELTVQAPRWTDEQMPSLGQALADIPIELELDPAVGFRVVVEGRQQVLTAAVRDEFYGVGREAIVNAYRHSRAEDIEVEVEYRCSELRVNVRDNGCGIDPERLRWGFRGHCGLKKMRERSDQIGARFRILSGVARGTEVELCVPGRIAFEQS